LWNRGRKLAQSARIAAARRPRTEDGPDVETKAKLGGLYVIEVADHDAALACRSEGT